MLRGQGFQVLEVLDGWAFGFDVVDGYVGYLPEGALADAPAPTHRVGVRSCTIYAAPDIKAADIGWLSFFAEVTVCGEEAGFFALECGGYISARHLVPLSWVAEDPVAVAEMFLGTPYLWGGDTAQGIDSGLVQVAFHAAGRNCARDADMQQAGLGTEFGDNVPLQRGDLLFWKGHVALVADAKTLIHANAGYMATVHEPVQAAIERIAAQGDGEVTARKRV